MLIVALMVCLQAAAPQEKKEDPKKAEPWKVSLGASYVFTDTMVRDPFDSPLASEILDRKDAGIDLQAAVSHDLYKIGPVVSELGLSFHQTSWFKNEDFHLTLFHPSLTLMLIESPVILTEMVGVKYASVGGDPFAQEVYSITAIGVAPVPVVLTYGFTATEYQTPTPTNPQDRDGVQHTLLALASLTDKPLQFKLGIFANWISTDGSDFDRVEWGPLAMLEYDLAWKTHWKTEVRWTSARYLNTNSLAPLRRSDGGAHVQTTVRKELMDELTATFTLEYRNNGSNIAAFDYDRLLIQLGLELKL